MMNRLLVLTALCVATSNGGLQLVNEKVTWSEAEKRCLSLGGHLVSIHSHDANEAAKAVCSNGGGSCWIGLFADSSSWKWSDGVWAEYYHFHGGAPSNWHASGRCVTMETKDDGEWSDVSCDTQAYPLCEGNGSMATLPPSLSSTTESDHGHPSHPSHPSHPPTSHSHGGGNSKRLSAVGTHFEMNGEKVFLSGTNMAWVAFGYDFGDNQYQYRRDQYEKFLKILHDAGGNSIRVWIHIEGTTSPAFDANGFVTGMDKQGTFVSDMQEYIRKAASYNILVFPTLWSGALKQQHQHLEGLIRDTSKLQSYIDKALIPMVTALKDEPGLGGWDIINEFEGEIRTDVKDPDPCLDTTKLQGSGAGWAGASYSAKEYLRFINWQTEAIRRADPEALVTAGSWNTRSNTDILGMTNYYSDKCLVTAGGKQGGTLTFYSTHCYDWQRKYDDYAPFRHNMSDYGLDKPLVIAEFNQVRGAGMDIVEQYHFAYTHGYAGAWSWQLFASGSDTDDTATQVRGISSLRNENDQSQGGRVQLHLVPS